MNSKNIFLIVGAVIAVVVIGFLVAGVDPEDNGNNPPEVRWLTYQSDDFHFSIQYPDTWQVREFLGDRVAPRVNIYKKTETKQPPFDHHSMVTQVSFFPQGVPTEGVFGLTSTSSVNLSEDTEHLLDYVTKDNQVWGTIIVPEAPPPPWNPGFIWMEAEISNFKESCIKDGTEIPMERCDQFTGDQIVQSGEVNTKDREVEEEMIKTFRFLPDSNDTAQLSL